MSKKNFDCTSRHRFGGWQTLHTDPELKTRSNKFSIDISSKKKLARNIAKIFIIRTTKKIVKRIVKRIAKRIGKKTRQLSKKLSAS